MFKMQVKQTNAAFADDPNGELARILREVADQVEDGHAQHNIRDVNGNLVGGWSIGKD